MPLSESELAQPASGRYAILVIGGDAVFLHDRRLGQKLYMGTDLPLTRPELRRYVASLNRDLDSLTASDFFAKYGLCG
jgi:hypothetical protein